MLTATNEPLMGTDLGTGRSHWKCRNQKWFVGIMRIKNTKLESQLRSPSQAEGHFMSPVTAVIVQPTG